MTPQKTTPPGSREFDEELAAIVRGLDRRRVSYLAGSGGWAEDPEPLPDRLVHHLLYRLPVFAQDRDMSPSEVLGPLLDAGTKTGLMSLGRAGPRPSGAALFIRGLAVFLQGEVWRRNARLPVPAWRPEEARRRREDLSRLAEMEINLAAALGEGVQARLRELFKETAEGPAAEFFDALTAHAAEEDRFLSEIQSLRRELSVPSRAEETAGLILEKIQPPLGIVTNISPALLLPCLRLLADKGLSPDSGIPYAASVILSILRDPRATAGLLRALKRFPLSCSKVRENLIYALGRLGEESAVPALTALLDEPDEISSGDGRVRLLLEQKAEAVWALGKAGAAAVSAIPALARCADSGSLALRTYAAWTLGEVGGAQKERSGGMDADVVIALLKLLKIRDRQVYEETVAALRRLHLPDFVHSLYFYHAGAVSLQGLLPARRGLYELSETLHYLIRTKGRAIMAVTGDSGTGKTYFCRAVAGGFGDLRPSDILYLMRDSKSGQKVFNRILGLRWLKKNIDPAYYQDYPLSEDEDNPHAYIDEFLEANKHKKLIILDGCRDRDYFQRVIDAFYERGVLDLDVTFRAAFSTRRLNLEEREAAMESVKIHLAFLEEPALEDTPFYREGVVLVYDFDNSAGSRLDREETLELFDRQKIEAWGGHLRLGSFDRGKRAVPSVSSRLDFEVRDLTPRESVPEPGRVRTFRQEERILRPLLNDDPDARPNLLETFALGDLAAERLGLYARDQAAGVSEDGRVFVLSFIDDRLLIARPGGEEDARSGGLALLGRDFIVLGGRGSLTLISFERNEIVDLGVADGRAPARALASSGRETVVTGHEDGSVVLRNLETGRSRRYELGCAPVRSLSCDLKGRVYAGTSGGELIRLEPESGRAEAVRLGGGQAVVLVKTHLRERVVAVTEETAVEGGRQSSTIHVLDLENRRARSIGLEPGGRLTCLAADYDGRILAGRGGGRGGSPSPGSLLILDLSGEESFLSELAGHARGTRDCLTMGPRIISCGLEESDTVALSIWGTEYYVRTESGKLAVREAWPSTFR